MPEQPEDEFPQKVCAFCAGTGKVRDYGAGNTSPFSMNTYFTVDSGLLGDFDFIATCGT